MEQAEDVQSRFLSEVLAERARQVVELGFTHESDLLVSYPEWTADVVYQLGKIMDGDTSDSECNERWVQIAALSLAAYEAHTYED